MTAAIGWFALAACDRPPGNDGTTPGTGDTGPEGLVLPGTTAPPASIDDLLGTLRVNWEDREDLVPGWTELAFQSQYWHTVDFGVETTVVVPAAGLDTCTALTASSVGPSTSEWGDAGFLTLTLDGAVLFEGEPNDFGTGGARGYQASRPEPAFGAVVGVMATGDGVIPPFEFPAIGVLPDEIGDFTPTRDEIVDVRGLTLTWDNPIGSEEMYISLGAVINLDCHVVDDGEWTLPDEYVSLLDSQDGGPIAQVNAVLRRGALRYIPVGERLLQVHVGNDRIWAFGGRL